MNKLYPLHDKAEGGTRPGEGNFWTSESSYSFRFGTGREERGDFF